MFFTKPITPPIIREEFDASKNRGVDKADIKAIHLALQNGEKLTIDRYGHIYTADQRRNRQDCGYRKDSKKVQQTFC